MTVKEFHRAQRLPRPPLGEDDIVVDPPQAVPRIAGTGRLARVVPVVLLVASGGLVAALVLSGSSVARNPLFLLFPLMMAASTVATLIQGGGGQWTAELNDDRRAYLSYLDRLRHRVVDAAEAQREARRWADPAPESLWSIVGGRRMWERRPSDPDFCAVRVGVAPQPPASALVIPEGAERGDPVTSGAVRRLAESYVTVADVPVTIGLGGPAAVVLRGDDGPARALLRAIICQLAVWHSPSELMLAAAISEDALAQWEWLKWLPHNQHPALLDDTGPRRMVYPSLNQAAADLEMLPVGRQVILIVDGVSQVPAHDRINGVVVLQPSDAGGDTDPDVTELVVSEGRVSIRQAHRPEIVTRPDLMGPIDALVCARRLASYRPGHAEVSRAEHGWRELIGLAEAGPKALWPSHAGRGRLRVPVGVSDGGEPLQLDIKEAAESGMGPHGLCVGATGSGKSEFLRTVALGMIAAHSPASLNLILVDFKGGATFLDLDRAPHVAAVITNLAEEAHLVARMQDALAGEINRRQEILRAAGNVVSALDYERARHGDASLPPLPALFLIIDEFSELLSRHPDFADIFAAIARLGRSLGMHLLLATQRLDEGKLRGLDSHLSYRVCLKTLSANESRVVLGTPDAYHLPSVPGAAYLQVGSGPAVRFQTSYVSGPHVSAPPALHRSRPAVVSPFTVAPVGPLVPVLGLPGPAPSSPERTVLQGVLAEVEDIGPPAHRVWLPPLASSPTLDAFATGPLDCGTGDFQVPIGLVDRPYEQRWTPLTIDLSGATGNVAIVGAPRSGKSTALRTVVTSLALRHDARHLQVYCLDFGGGALTSLLHLPQVGAVGTRVEPDLVRRIVAEIAATIRYREERFRELGVDSVARYRERSADNGQPGDLPGEVVLVIDGLAAIRQEFDDLDATIAAIAAEGLSYGVHLAFSAARWADIRPALRDQVGTRIELRLGDPGDSEIDRTRARQVPENRPGHGLTPEGLHMVVALPRVDGIGTPDGLVAAASAIGDQIRLRDGDVAAPPIRLLPPHVEHHRLLADAGDTDGRFLIGLGERRIAPVTVDFAKQPHLIVFGEADCGKSAALRLMCTEIMRTRPPSRARVLVVDFRRTLAGVAGMLTDGQLLGYAPSAPALSAHLPELLQLLRDRLPGSDVNTAEMGSRSGWSGPEVFIVVDDYDLVATTAGNPLAPILDVLPHARDIGLHLLIARRSAGAARALYEPVLGAVRDLGAMGLQMSASPDEGPLLGSSRPCPLPPGRAKLVTRADGEQLVQLGWEPP